MSACALAISYLLFSCFYSIGVTVALRQGPRLKRQFEFMNRLVDRAHRAGSRHCGGGMWEMRIKKGHGRTQKGQSITGPYMSLTELIY
jgi:hypothetical protein